MESLDKRISRILGQMRGIQKMVKEQRDSTSVLQQVSAVKKAIDGLTREIILLYLADMLPSEKKKEVEKIIEQAINL
ncbi:metal-sensitive transcriptional regulator [Candidatus Woesebacteria bacterium]|nr:metal-sensitive transcriptional regulator [Candidatus Woesebacteria bacterium]